MISPLIISLLIACDKPATTEPLPPEPKVEVPTNATTFAFQNAASLPPKGWTGRVFKLSADYPTEPPAPCAHEVCTWLDVDVDFGDGTKAPDWEKGKWAEYMAALKTYVMQGQDPNLTNNIGVRVEVDGRTRWYHVPWMAYDPTVGRDFVHGTTNERTAHVSDLIGSGIDSGNIVGLPDSTVAPSCQAEGAKGFETWAVGVYNEYGGWVFGQAFPRSGGNAGVPQITTDPESKRAFLAGLPFPEGTLVAKFLTTNAPVECVSFLAGSPEWQVDRHTSDNNGNYLCKREVQTSRIVQVDVAVVDARSPTRWVYTTFVYNGTLEGENFWDRLQPLGVQWGSDSKAFPAVPKDQAGPVVQTVLNPALKNSDVKIKIYEHEGCNQRLAGPVDNPASSCMSCHSASFAPPLGEEANMGHNEPPIFGFAGMCDPTNTDQQTQNTAYFSDAVYPAPYDGGRTFKDTIPMDTSLQLLVAMNQYAIFSNPERKEKPAQCDLDAKAKEASQRESATPGSAPAPTTPPQPGH